MVVLDVGCFCGPLPLLITVDVMCCCCCCFCAAAVKTLICSEFAAVVVVMTTRVPGATELDGNGIGNADGAADVKCTETFGLLLTRPLWPCIGCPMLLTMFIFLMLMWLSAPETGT